MWEVPLETQQSEVVENNIPAKKHKPELSHYIYAAHLSPTTSSLLKEIKLGFLKNYPGLIEKLIKNHLKIQLTRQWDTCT